jgi:ribosomal protection tetracycline resistance protein
VDRQFALPSLAALVEPARVADHVPLRAALAQLAEQDPLIDVRDLAVSLYGEVQKEVVAATLAADYGIEVRFRETTPLYVERPRRVATAVERLNTPSNPFHATVGLRVAPAAPGSGVSVRVAVDHRTVPLYVYRNYEEFARSMEGYVRSALAEGRHGWPVVDCVVTMTACGYSVADGPPSLRGPDSTAADYRKLTPMVLMAALDRAGVVVCEPLSRVRVEAPASALGPLLSRLGAAVVGHSARGDEVVVEAVLPATEVRAVQRAVPSLTNGEGAVEATHAGHRPVRRGPVPTRPRTTPDPLNRDEYLAAVRL